MIFWIVTNTDSVFSPFPPHSNFIPQPIGKCRRVFQALLPYAVEELCNVAESLIVPVRMGIARPTAPFTLASTSIDAVQGSEELFSVEPLPPRPSPDQSSRLVGFSTFVFLSGGDSRLFLFCFFTTYSRALNYGELKCACIVSVSWLRAHFNVMKRRNDLRFFNHRHSVEFNLERRN